MAVMLDTSVAIHLRDGDENVRDRVAALTEAPVLSIITQIELEGGVTGENAAVRRERLDRMFATLSILPFGPNDATAYSEIIAERGFSRRRTMDRLIAAQAITAKATLITLNGADFRDVPGLNLLEW
jgi:predicted nucleic acid-binding protein